MLTFVPLAVAFGLAAAWIWWRRRTATRRLRVDPVSAEWLLSHGGEDR